MSIYTQAQSFGPKLIDIFKNPIQGEHQRKTRTPDGAGGFTVAWNTIRNIDVAIVPKSGTDRLQSDRTENMVKAMMYVKYNDINDFEYSDRIVHDGKIYRVLADFDIAKAKAVIKFTTEEGKAT